MATPRVEIPEIVINNSGAPISGASVQVNVHGGGAATVYTTESGGVTAANPVITDSAGRIEGYVPEGSYDLVVSGTGLTTYTQYFEASKGSNSPGALMTSTGDILYAASANNAARLGVGGSTTVLHGGTTPAYSAVVEGDVTLADVTTLDVSTTKHGLVPKAPNDTAKFLRGDATWAAATGATYRKTTAKVVNTTTSATDLLNAEITLAANVLSTDRVVRFSCGGDWKQNSGGTADLPRFQLSLGGTVILDTGVPGVAIPNAATRYGWSIEAKIAETGATNSQSVRMTGTVSSGNPGGSSSAAFTTGEGVYRALISSAAGSLGEFTGWNSATKDGTGTLALVLNVINASASASYETVLKDALVVIE